MEAEKLNNHPVSPEKLTKLKAIKTLKKSISPQRKMKKQKKTNIEQI